MSKSAREVIETCLQVEGREHRSAIILERLKQAGYVILPKEPSEKMIEAAYQRRIKQFQSGNAAGPYKPQDDYRAMTKAYEEEMR